MGKILVFDHPFAPGRIWFNSRLIMDRESGRKREIASKREFYCYLWC